MQMSIAFESSTHTGVLHLFAVAQQICSECRNILYKYKLQSKHCIIYISGLG